MSFVSKLMKTRWYPRPHDMENGWFHRLEPGNNSMATIYPMVMYDEGLGDPASYNAHREHASFVVAGEPNCYPESRVDLITAKLELSLTKPALRTDNLVAVKCAYMPIFMSFKEDYIAIDELTSVETQDLIEMQTESTDRQGYPLYNGTKMPEKYSGSGTLAANVPGLTTTQIIEAVTFFPNNFYDGIHYLSIAGKLKAIQGGLKWLTLTENRPLATIKIRLRPKVKRMNPYTFFGCMVYVPDVDTATQTHVSADTTNINHVEARFMVRYNEWNQAFDFNKV